MTAPHLLPGELALDLFERRHVGRHGAFILRTNRRHVEIARAAVAHRLEVPVGSIEIDWSAVKAKAPVKLRRAA